MHVTYLQDRSYWSYIKYEYNIKIIYIIADSKQFDKNNSFLLKIISNLSFSSL